ADSGSWNNELIGNKPKNSPQLLDDPARAPAMANAIPPAISTMLTIGDTRSLWLVFTPMFTSPALIPCVSVRGMGTRRDAIPSTTTSNPANSRIFINDSVEGCTIQRVLLKDA